ncbi:DUF1266 domain-containing protein [Pseudomonas sp. NCHU5208]|uniref:DUF1266 domain-containing protein n=1 Tax=unclassified Pseudomonas TaxID=196821 RepID=UPI003F9A88B0
MDDLQKRWLFALSAPMVAINRHAGADYALASLYPDNEFVDLKESWEIAERADLLAMIQRMTDDGHARELSTAYWEHARLLPSQWQALLDSLQPAQRVAYEFVAETSMVCGAAGIRAWDLGRMSFLARIGQLNGWLNLEENLWLHSRLSLRARYYYQSWHSYLAGFVIGRAYWNCLGHEEANEQALSLSRQGSEPAHRAMVRELALSPAAGFEQLPWDMELELPEKPDSLEAFDWS